MERPKSSLRFEFFVSEQDAQVLEMVCLPRWKTLKLLVRHLNVAAIFYLFLMLLQAYQ